ncbi:MAG: hypothetical protein EP301_01655 [Gammaproteobacteria bacterium]|nr:MAG: hypothetical protein EP301_01655 [Gammaproteobacteria bacterium]
MTIAALELNDQSLLIEAEDGSQFSEPGFARLSGDGIVSGEEARAVAWREPQHVYNQYWCHLNQTPLPVRHRHARHHADIAFAQLKKLWEQVGRVDALILLAPGSFSRNQLSLLLGMVEALPSQPLAVIDSALAACADVDCDTLHVDLQMHESVLTVCRPQGGSVRIVGQEVFSGLGMAQMQNAMARHISDLLVESYRFDPLHSSAAEQAIFDQIPQWLTRLRWDPEVSIKVDSEQGELSCILRRDAIKDLIGSRIESMRSFIERWPDCSLLLGSSSAPLTGLVDEFAKAEVTSRFAGTRRCIAGHAELLEQVDDLYRIRTLSRVGKAESGPELNGERLATHLLWEDLALPLSKPVSIRLADRGPRLSNELDQAAELTVVMHNRVLETLHCTVDVSLPATCRPGESIRIGGYEIKLIRVRGA